MIVEMFVVEMFVVDEYCMLRATKRHFRRVYNRQLCFGLVYVPKARMSIDPFKSIFKNRKNRNRFNRFKSI